ncbi:hypothetical protein MOQ_009237 [Trypanosoma cruzi marinkellei]|uniref:4a-hydroxytetrahydrobiopterin dehydratase n=1 Tax=Trypanosoma cruzi marinkellei TaxID=85056 RepID=K2MN06_TRYCR|nr:hypothetical protein MOQ_009237 [Trypanosoma cruzi marinkellei]
MIVWSRRVSTSVLFCSVFNNPFSAAFVTSSRWKGDYGFNVFHNSNPQHGGSYARHERRMREDEVEDFLRSVKGWVPADETVTASPAMEGSSEAAEAEKGPTPMTVFTGEEAIKREFVFPTFRDAYLFMGRVWAFCYGSDKYPHVTWDGTRITVYLYSPSFRGISKREARLAAFLNDQYNMFRKSKRQQEQLLSVAVKKTRVEELMGDVVAEKLRQREEERRRPLAEATKGSVVAWESLIDENIGGKKKEESYDNCGSSHT